MKLKFILQRIGLFVLYVFENEAQQQAHKLKIILPASGTKNMKKMESQEKLQKVKEHHMKMGERKEKLFISAINHIFSANRLFFLATSRKYCELCSNCLPFES